MRFAGEPLSAEEIEEIVKEAYSEGEGDPDNGGDLDENNEE